MRRVRNSVSALLLSAILLSSLTFYGCAKQEGEKSTAALVQGSENQTVDASSDNLNKEGLPILKEKEVFRIVVPQRSPIKSAAEKLCVLNAEKATNVQIEWIEIPASGWIEKINIMFSTDSLPDAIIDDIDMARNFEQLAVLDKYLEDYAPAVTKFFNERDDYPNALKAPDQTIRTLPIGDESVHNIIDSHLWINQKWLDNLSLKMPTTVDELKEVLLAFRDRDPNGNGQKDEIPFTFRDAWGWGVTIENFFGTYGVIENDDHVFMKDGKVIFSAAEDGYYDTLKYLHDLFKEGLIDKDIFTLSPDQYAARGSAGDILGLVAGYEAFEAGVKDPGDYRVLPILKNKDKEGVIGLNNITKKGGFYITKACKNPAALVRWYDYINSDVELAMEWGRGPKGVWWDTFEENGQKQIRFLTMDKDVLQKNGAYKNKGEYRNAESFAGVTPSLARYEYLKAVKYDEKWPKDLKLEAVESQMSKGLSGLPAGTATLENSERRAILKTDIDSYLKKFIADSVLNGLDDSGWAAHKEALKKLRVEEYVSLCQEFVDLLNR